jgi:hypothetical protein
VTAVTHEGLETGETDLGWRPRFLPSLRKSNQEGPDEDIFPGFRFFSQEEILNRFNTDEIVTVIGVIVCMVEALVVAIFLLGFIGDHVNLFFDFGYSTGIEGFS